MRPRCVQRPRASARMPQAQSKAVCYAQTEGYSHQGDDAAFRPRAARWTLGCPLGSGRKQRQGGGGWCWLREDALPRTGVRHLMVKR
jgi:hypothetical protein